MEEKKVTNLSPDDRKRFTFLRAWQEVFDALQNYEQKGKYAEAIINYCFFGIEPNFDNAEDYALSLVWIQTKEAANFGLTKYCSGKMGGAPIGNNNAQKTTEKQPKTTKKQPKTSKNNTTLHYTILKKEIKLPLNKEKSGGGGDVLSDENNKPTEAELTEFIKAENLEYIQPEQLYQELTERDWKMIDGNDIKAWKSYVRKVNADRKKDKQPIAAWAKQQPKDLSGKVYE